MKKIISIFIAIIFAAGMVFADESVLFDYTVQADVLDTGYDWVSNAKAVGVSGRYIPGKNLTNPIVNEKYGLCIRTDDAPNEDSNYAIAFLTPEFNEPNIGAGYIRNAAAVKSMDITIILNRGEDEVTIYWMQNGKENHRKFIPSRDADVTVESMTEFNCHIDFGEYVDDVRNRDNRQIPAAGPKMSNIYLTKIQVTTHKQTNWVYYPTSILGIKKISMVYDKAVTDEAYERGVEADEIFNIDTSEDLKNKTLKKVQADLRMTEQNKALMAKEESAADAK